MYYSDAGRIKYAYFRVVGSLEINYSAFEKKLTIMIIINLLVFRRFILDLFRNLLPNWNQVVYSFKTLLETLLVLENLA
jgi:hypothetical protein